MFAVEGQEISAYNLFAARPLLGRRPGRRVGLMAPGTEEEACGDLVRKTEDIADSQRLYTQEGPLASVWTGLTGDGDHIVVLLTDPGPYEEALLALVEHPDRVRFRRSTHTRLDLEAIRSQVVASIDDSSLISHGLRLEHVNVTLRSNRTADAQRLHQRFGDVLEITLGQHRYPLQTTEVLPPSPAPTSTNEFPDVVTTVLPDAPTFVTGEDIGGQVLIENRGTAPLVVQTGVIAFGVLLDEHRDVVGTWNGATTLPSRRTPVTPGSRITHRFIAGSDTSDPRLGASLPPGTYSLVISINIEEDDEPTPHHHTLVTKPLSIELTA